MSENLTGEQQQKLNGLIKKGKEILDGPRIYTKFTGKKEIDDLINNIEKYSHLFVLGCVMDRQIKSEKAWTIPYLIMKELGGFEFNRLLELRLDNLIKIFNEKKLHRFNNDMARNFYKAIQKIKNNYDGNASKIWTNNPSAAAIICKFLEFDGVGQKIANMAVNILVRELKVPIKNLSAIDISADTHVIRMMKKLGFAPEDATREYIIFRAREFYPEYPGILDIGLFQMGREERASKRKEGEE